MTHCKWHWLPLVGIYWVVLVLTTPTTQKWGHSVCVGGAIENIPVEEERGVSHPKTNGERPQEHHSKGEESAYRERGRILFPIQMSA